MQVLTSLSPNESALNYIYLLLRNNETKSTNHIKIPLQGCNRHIPSIQARRQEKKQEKRECSASPPKPTSLTNTGPPLLTSVVDCPLSALRYRTLWVLLKGLQEVKCQQHSRRVLMCIPCSASQRLWPMGRPGSES